MKTYILETPNLSDRVKTVLAGSTFILAIYLFAYFNPHNLSTQAASFFVDNFGGMFLGGAIGVVYSVASLASDNLFKKPIFIFCCGLATVVGVLLLNTLFQIMPSVV